MPQQQPRAGTLAETFSPNRHAVDRVRVSLVSPGASLPLDSRQLPPEGSSLSAPGHSSASLSNAELLRLLSDLRQDVNEMREQQAIILRRLDQADIGKASTRRRRPRTSMSARPASRQATSRRQSAEGAGSPDAQEYDSGAESGSKPQVPLVSFFEAIDEDQTVREFFETHAAPRDEWMGTEGDRPLAPLVNSLMMLVNTSSARYIKPKPSQSYSVFATCCEFLKNQVRATSTTQELFGLGGRFEEVIQRRFNISITLDPGELATAIKRTCWGTLVDLLVMPVVLDMTLREFVAGYSWLFVQVTSQFNMQKARVAIREAQSKAHSGHEQPSTPTLAAGRKRASTMPGLAIPSMESIQTALSSASLPPGALLRDFVALPLNEATIDPQQILMSILLTGFAPDSGQQALPSIEDAWYLEKLSDEDLSRSPDPPGHQAILRLEWTESLDTPAHRHFIHQVVAQWRGSDQPSDDTPAVAAAHQQLRHRIFLRHTWTEFSMTLLQPSATFAVFARLIPMGIRQHLMRHSEIIENLSDEIGAGLSSGQPTSPPPGQTSMLAQLHRQVSSGDRDLVTTLGLLKPIDCYVLFCLLCDFDAASPRGEAGGSTHPSSALAGLRASRGQTRAVGAELRDFETLLAKLPWRVLSVLWTQPDQWVRPEILDQYDHVSGLSSADTLFAHVFMLLCLIGEQPTHLRPAEFDTIEVACDLARQIMDLILHAFDIPHSADDATKKQVAAGLRSPESTPQGSGGTRKKQRRSKLRVDDEDD